MTWREKLAWVNLAAMVAAYGFYFWKIRTEPHSTPEMLLLFGAVSLSQAAVVLLTLITLFIAAGSDGLVPADERDRQVARRGANIAYFVLMAFMILVGVVMPFGDSGQRITNAALLSLAVSETVRHLIIVAGYRRGWRA